MQSLVAELVFMQRRLEARLPELHDIARKNSRRRGRRRVCRLFRETGRRLVQVAEDLEV
jgi:hypothetical protein